MKITLLYITVCALLCSCGLIHFGHRPEKSGCPMGRNIGAEKILSGDPKAAAALRKAGNYKMDKGLSRQ